MALSVDQEEELCANLNCVRHNLKKEKSRFSSCSFV